MAEKYNYVALVDAGDAIQGDTIGTLSKGEYLVDIMNEVGYDVVVPATTNSTTVWISSSMSSCRR